MKILQKVKNLTVNLHIAEKLKVKKQINTKGDFECSMFICTSNIN